MLDILITSRTRVRLLLKFFSNSRTQSYLYELAGEFGESTNAVRIELNRLSQANLLTSETNGRKRMYRANRHHPFYPELKNLVHKYMGLDHIQRIPDQLQKVQSAIITGDYACGRDTGVIDLMIIGSVQKSSLATLAEKVEKIINRRIRTLVVSKEEFEIMKDSLNLKSALVLGTGEHKDGPVTPTEDNDEYKTNVV